LFIVYGTTLPFEFSASSDVIQARVRRIWEHPLRGGSWHDVYSNILFFLPWGFLLAIWLAKRGTSYLVAAALALVSGTVFSGLVECAQLFAVTRFPSFVDVVTNTFGSTVGGLIGWPLARWVWPVAAVAARRTLVARPLSGCAAATAAGFLLVGVIPQYVNVSDAATQATKKTMRPIPFMPPVTGVSSPSKPWLWGAELCAWTLAGGVFAMAIRQSGARGVRAILATCGCAGALSATIEILQILVRGRDVDATSVVLALAGSAAGGAIVLRSAPARARDLVPGAIAVWAAAVALGLWSPPRFTWPEPPYMRPERLIPFWSYFYSRSLEDLADVIGQVVFFTPLGALLAARWWRISFPAAVAIGLAAGVAFEFGQAFLPGRSVDISDAISAATGTGLGLALWRWGESLQKSSQGVIRYRVGSRGA
jgi:VanZ family protein